MGCFFVFILFIPLPVSLSRCFLRPLWCWNLRNKDLRAKYPEKHWFSFSSFDRHAWHWHTYTLSDSWLSHSWLSHQLWCPSTQVRTIAAWSIKSNELSSVWLTAPLLPCHTQIELAWWITHWIMMDYHIGIHDNTHTNTIWPSRSTRLWLTLSWFTAGWDQICWFYWPQIWADSVWYSLFYLFNTSYVSRCVHWWMQKKETSWRCHRLLLLTVTLNVLLW